MKRRVELSTWSVMLTVISTAMLCAIAYYAIRSGGRNTGLLVIAILVVWLLLALFYMPVAISVDDKDVCIHRPLRIKSIPFTEIADVQLTPPTMAERRICGSGGFLGYWGHFSERDLGRYFAYYGRSSDTFLLTLKNGRKYMLGCTDAPTLAAAITHRLH